MFKRLTINKYQKALVFNKKDELIHLLSEGQYWLKLSDTSFVYDVFQDFTSPINPGVLLEHPDILVAMDLVEIKDNEIVLMYVNGVLAKVLNTGRHLFWKSPLHREFIRVNLNEPMMDAGIDKNILTHKLMVPYVKSFVVDTFEQAVLFVNGAFHSRLDSGVHYFWRNNIPVVVYKTDSRMQQLEMSGQEMLTKDKASVRMNAFATYRTVDVMKALVENKDFEKQLYVNFQLVLRALVGSQTLDELMVRKESLENTVLQWMADKAASLGVEVYGFGIRDLILPGDVRDILNAVLLAEKKALANSIMRREETASTRSLLNTARLLEDNPMLYKLKEMEFVEKVAENIKSIQINGNTAILDQLSTLLVTK